MGVHKKTPQQPSEAARIKTGGTCPLGVRNLFAADLKRLHVILPVVIFTADAAIPS